MRNSISASIQQIAVRAPTQVGQALRRWRIKKGLTQVELAKKTRLTQKTISQIESGSKTVKLMTIFAICSALDLELKITERSKSVEDWNPKELFG